VGASTLAALVAARLARRTATVLVGVDPGGPGLDVLVGIEDLPGARWPDLALARGELDGLDVLELLPRWGPCAVLATGRGPAATSSEVRAVAVGGGSADDDATRDVVAALARVVGAVVLDVPGSASGLPVAADLGVVVAGRDLLSLAGGLRLGSWLGACASGGLVVRGPAPGGMATAELADAVGLPLLWSGRADRTVARATERGLLAGRARARRGGAARAAHAVVEAAWRVGPWAP
jgi:hypothetical protein